MLPLDAHAHFEPSIAPTELAKLHACAFAVTRSLDEYRLVANRHDPNVAWGVGCHPSLVRAIGGFDAASFKASLATAPVVGEIGLDGRSRVPMEAQQNVLGQVFNILDKIPRIASVHSFHATKPVLRMLEQFQPKGVVLHWWLGDDDDTTRAVELGAYFSVNAAQAVRWPTLRLVPKGRLLTETDHPFGDRQESAPRRPGNVLLAERRLGAVMNQQSDEVRGLAWRNLRLLVDELRLHDLLPPKFHVQLLAG